MKRRSGGLLSIAALVIAAGGPTAWASEEIATMEGLECAVCHDDPEIAELSDRGHYYQYMRTLEGYELVVRRFGRCTYCHVQQAGSLELSKDGQRFRWMMEDMEGLRVWLEENHPRPADDPEPTEQSDAEPDDDNG